MTEKSTFELPTYFLSHGGGPWPWMKAQTGDTYARLEESLRAMPSQIGENPTAVLMISAHWEEREFTVMTHPQPPMVYDYFGFPQHTYQIQYPAPGSPQLAKRVSELIQEAGLACQPDGVRGFDHGMFVPMAVIFPQANLPTVQLSLRRDLDPAAHLALGRSLRPLRSEGILIIGSGLSYHNLRKFGPQAKVPSAEFDRWLNECLALPNAQERCSRLLKWASAPSARLAHPREEHLIPLLVALGAAEAEMATCIYHEDEFFGGASVSSFAFGALQASRFRQIN